VKAGEDAFMVGAYGEFSFTLGRYAFQISGANYGFGRVDQIAVATSTGPLESINTNRLALGPAGEVIGFASDFNLVDVIGEVSIDTGRAEYPVRLLADWVRNTGATTDRDSGVWLEVGYGRGRSAGTFSTGYTFGHVEEDAVLSPFVFSDMPGSNLTLHMVEASYVLAPGLSIDFTLHVTKRLLVPTDSANPFRVRPHLAAVARF